MYMSLGSKLIHLFTQLLPVFTPKFNIWKLSLG